MFLAFLHVHCVVGLCLVFRFSSIKIISHSYEFISTYLDKITTESTHILQSLSLCLLLIVLESHLTLQLSKEGNARTFVLAEQILSIPDDTTKVKYYIPHDSLHVSSFCHSHKSTLRLLFCVSNKRLVGLFSFL